METPRASHVYAYCSDLAATRAFYEGALGLPVIEANADFVEFNMGASLTFLRSKLPAAAHSPALGFSSFPGWDGGPAERALCSLRCAHGQLDAIRSALTAAGAQHTAPELRDGAWEMRALDPAGNTVELYAVGE